MKKRNDYISDKLIYSGERLKSHQEQAIGETGTGTVPAPAASECAPAKPLPPPVPVVDRKHFDEYFRIRREQLLRLAEFSALLEAELSDCRKTVAEAERLQLVFDQFFQELNDLPENFDAVNLDSGRFADHTRRLEQARLVIVRHTAAVRKLLGQSTGERNGNNSIIHEIASLSFLQLLRLGLGLALPVFFGIIVAALIIGATIIMTMGGV